MFIVYRMFTFNIMFKHYLNINLTQQIIIKRKVMQNQIHYGNLNGNNGQMVMTSPKYVSQNYIKTFDKTLQPPVSSLKHYASNPNISLEFANPKQPNPVEQNSYNFNQINKNIDFRGQPNNINMGFNSTQASSSRASRQAMTQSLIINQNQKVQVPQEVPSPKKQLFKNTPKRAYRMSETTDDSPYSPGIRKQQHGGFLNKDVNFYKNKEGIQKQQKNQQKKDEKRQVPSFLHRTNSLNINMDLKKSCVIQPTYQKPSPTLQRPLPFNMLKLKQSKSKKVSVEDFIKIKQLGNGKYGRVYLVKQKYTGFICALKVIEKKLLHQQQITDQFIRQVKIQIFLNHPNIIKLYGCFHDATNIFIILEVGTGGQLYHQLKKAQPLNQARIAFIMKQVCEAVNEIHSYRIIHRDIKPQNIVLHDNIIKLCDFGWSVHQDNKLRTTFCGTPLYVCPQILKGKQYDEKIDIWSIGIMMYEMVVGQNPFKITRQQQLIKIVKDEIKIPAYLFVSAEVRDFLDKCLQKNPNQRSSIKQLMNHPFFKKHQEKVDKSKVINM